MKGSRPSFLSCLVSLCALAPGVAASTSTGAAEGAPEVAETWRTLRPFEQEHWENGRDLFTHEFEGKEGLGAPLFNDVSCAACHSQPVIGGAGDLLSNVFPPPPPPEAPPDPTPATSVKYYVPVNRDALKQRLALQDLDTAGPRKRLALLRGSTQSSTLLGLGHIDAIPDEEILRRADPDDEDGDGIRGRASLVELGDQVEVGRFGWHARAPTLRDFVSGACGGELGLTVPDDGRGFGLISDSDLTADPEMKRHELIDLVYFCSQLAPPERVSPKPSANVLYGEKLFELISCTKCHVPSMQSGRGEVALYSDLLLHEVVPDLAPTLETNPKRPKDAKTALAFDEEGAPLLALVRTPPLWGVSRTPPYLHDGRARSLREAILAHQGEAEASRAEFEELSDYDQRAVIAFLEDL